MEISGNSYNQPVNFYTKNTENMIPTYKEGENRLYTENVFVPETVAKKVTKPIRKTKKNKRLNTFDTEYLPDEASDTTIKENENNFFIQKEENKIFNNIKKSFEWFVSSTPLINYFFLRQKKERLRQTVEKLNDISQNVDELLTTAVPYGENGNMYSDYAKNLTDAAIILNKANKNL